MAIDAERLLRFSIPSVRQRVTPRDAAFYALSIGLGRDPLDVRQLPYVDPLAGPPAVPSLALVLAHPGFWLGNPDSGVDPTAVLHGMQAFEVFAPIPVDAEIESQTRIIRLVDKGPGKAALMLTETDLLDADGTPIARLDRTTFIRNGGGFGGDPSLPGTSAPSDPQGAPDSVVDLPTDARQALLYRLNGDYNPLHSDPTVAAQAGFARPILHGLCTMGVIVHALLQECCRYQAELLRSVSLRFAAPVLPGETIRTEIWRDGTFRARVLERDVVVADQGCYGLGSSAAPETPQ